MWTAIIREVSPALADCELSFVDRERIDVARARAQHAAYCNALAELGCEVIRLPAERAFPDSVFVEDVALAFDEVAVATRPGDVLRIGRRVFVGESARSNQAGREQLRELLAPYGYTVEGVAMRDCLHLKSAVTQVADDVLLVNPAWLVDASVFAGYRRIEVDPCEGYAANAVRIGDALVYPDCFPNTLARLRDAGIAVRTVDVSELQKAEGAVTCCSVLLRNPPAAGASAA